MCKYENVKMGLYIRFIRFQIFKFSNFQIFKLNSHGKSS